MKNIRHTLTVALAVFAVLLSSFAAFGGTSGATVEQEQGTSFFCNSANKPSGKSIAMWHEANGFDGTDCFDYTVNNVCGGLDVQLTNNTNLKWAFAIVEGDSVTLEGASYNSVSFPEGYNGGSVDVTFFAVGAEKDYFRLAVNSGDFPNFWNGVGETVTVKTNCEPPVTTSTTTTTVKPTTTTVAPTTTTAPELIPPVAVERVEVFERLDIWIDVTVTEEQEISFTG